MVIKSPAPRGAPSFLRKVHRAMALREIYHSSGLSRVELADRIGLSSMAVGRIVKELELSGLIGETEPSTRPVGRGRPGTALALQGDGAYVVGAVISAFSQQIVVLNLLGDVVVSKEVTLTDISDGPGCVRETCDQIKALLAETRLPSNKIIGVGFACAAGIDRDQGIVTSGGYVGWQPFNFTALAQELLNLPVTLSNIADALLQAEMFFGCARERSAVVLVHCSTGLATSFASNGQIFTGAHHRAGRLGHFPATRTRLTCSCGGSNCLNCSASGWSLLNQLDVVNSPVYTPELAQTYAVKINKLVQSDRRQTGESPSTSRVNQVLKQSGQALGKSLCLIELTFDPDMLVLAGSLATNDAYFNGVLSGLNKSSQFGVDLAAKISRSRLLPVTGAGLISLLYTVYAPEFDLERLHGSSGKANFKSNSTSSSRR